ncbi:hypothetical protein GcM1_05829 [Golovinomyces cichoracearum]|uniref:Uncharacterized protein n=1 Tax=Golovinomyces cichoracearum TaxID=62708 RepID=A0A420J4J3_9PEZI|nr:hypothetical protein GcM1_05829 [Golovinomyces cichoracearum]
MNTHQFSCLLVLIFTCHFAAVSALVTLDTIKEMTIRMDKSTGKITGSRKKYINFDEDEDEIYDPIKTKKSGLLASRALRKIGLFLKSELNQPMKRQPTLAKKYNDKNSYKCIIMRSEFNSFIKSSNKLIDAVEKNIWVPKKLLTVGDLMSEIKSRLSTKSSISRTEKRLIRKRLHRIQKLWASRKPNSENLSFIEQQQKLYDSTSCFSSTPNRVLTENMAIVARLNKLIELFK